MGFEPSIPAFERAKTVHDLDRAATMIGLVSVYSGHTPGNLYVITLDMGSLRREVPNEWSDTANKDLFSHNLSLFPCVVCNITGIYEC
jgi:hypothetical protein